MDFKEHTEQLALKAADGQTDWEEIGTLLSGICFSDMKNVPQDPVYHGEGDVYIHTQKVCGELGCSSSYRALPADQKAVLFLAALLHDIGKVKTTRLENGRWAAPHHASTGSLMAREFLWKDCGLCGTADKVRFRESVCALIAHHIRPVHMITQTHPEQRLRNAAAIGELAEDFSWELLCVLSEADMKGRIAADIEEAVTRIRLSAVMAEESGCLTGPYQFSDPFTKHAYLQGRDVLPDQTLFDNTWGEVILMSGLPGTGKDTWIREKTPELPAISLDEIRELSGTRPDKDQGAVLQSALAQAKRYLRQKQPFVWNATNLYRETRQNLVSLFERYGARVRIVYLETDWNERIRRNADRSGAVPEKQVEKMLGKLVPPLPDEAQTVEWLFI